MCQNYHFAQSHCVLSVTWGVVFMLIGFLGLPPLLGVPGIWLAVPLAELLTLLYIIGLYLKDRCLIRQ